MKDIVAATLLTLTGTLTAQEAVCVPVFASQGSSFPWPPVIGGGTVIPGTHLAGACPTGYCQYNFDVLVALTSPAGLSFEVCFNPPAIPLCVPYVIPIDPTLPPVTQVLDESFSVGVQCGDTQQIKLNYVSLLGNVTVVTIDMTCDKRDC